MLPIGTVDRTSGIADLPRLVGADADPRLGLVVIANIGVTWTDPGVLGEERAEPGFAVGPGTVLQQKADKLQCAVAALLGAEAPPGAVPSIDRKTAETFPSAIVGAQNLANGTGESSW